MKLALKFNLILIPLLLLGLMVAGFISYRVLHQNARQEVQDRANLMMEAALAMRMYTVKEIRPLLDVQNRRQFLPQTVSAYAATQLFNTLREKHPEYTYKEATLNPTNPRDRAVDWEADIIQRFINNDKEEFLVGERDNATGRSLYFARPLRITDPNCLKCHSTPDAAPETMIKLYGTANGFGWKLNEVVGAQVLSIPMEVPVQNARRAFLTFMGILAGMFVFSLLVLNFLLHTLVSHPVKQVTALADRISKGEEDLPEFSEQGVQEISALGASFNRMKRSLEKAMAMLN
jgi:protein-histidine pros-kinase